MAEAIDVTVPAEAEEREDWQAQAEAERNRKAEILGRCQQMETEGSLKLEEERRALEAERKELLVEGKPTTGIREKLRRNLQAREDLAAECRELREAAGGIDASIRAAEVKTAQARQAEISEEAPALVARMAEQLDALRGTVEELEALRREDYRCYQFVSQLPGAKRGGHGIPGVQWSHRAWTALVEALDATRELKIDVPEA